MSRVLLSACLAALMVGCGPSAEGYDYLRPEGCETPCEPDAGVDAGPSDAGAPVIPEEPLEDWDTEGAGPLSGIFAVEVQIPARAVVEVETRQLYRLRILQRGTEVQMRITPCRFALPSVPSVATLSIPPRLEAVLRGLSVEELGPFLSAADPVGAELTTPQVTVVLGAELDAPTSDPLPTVELPDSAVDQDDDGQPGVTVAADTILCRDPPEDLYLALRATVSMSTTIEDLDRLQGAVTPTLEQSVLGVSDPCLATAAMLEIELLEGASFDGIRLGDAEDLDHNSNVSCPEITVAAPDLFGPFWSAPGP